MVSFIPSFGCFNESFILIYCSWYFSYLWVCLFYYQSTPLTWKSSRFVPSRPLWDQIWQPCVKKLNCLQCLPSAVRVKYQLFSPFFQILVQYSKNIYVCFLWINYSCCFKEIVYSVLYKKMKALARLNGCSKRQDK